MLAVDNVAARVLDVKLVDDPHHAVSRHAPSLADFTDDSIIRGERLRDNGSRPGAGNPPRHPHDGCLRFPAFVDLVLYGEQNDGAPSELPEQPTPSPRRAKPRSRRPVSRR